MAATPEPSGFPDRPRQNLQRLRDRLLALHKALIESERIGYEQTFGTIPNPNRFLQLLIHDPWFAWLHPLSELLVVMDETLEADPPPDAETVLRLFDQTRALLQTSEEGDGFPRSYFEALQREPDVVLAHAAVSKCLKPARH
jgi:hypothetical protein